jgi:hypothetical protein
MKFVVFALGYGHKAEYVWNFFHFDPAVDSKIGGGPITAVLFDFGRNEVRTWNDWDGKRGRAPEGKPDVQALPTKEIRLLGGELSEDKASSIVSLYEWVKSQNRGSVASLQVFGHSIAEGPVVVNSYELDPDSDLAEARDSNDMDGRLRDFYGSNPLGGIGGSQFAGAFSRNAFIKLWGCSYVKDRRKAFKRAIKGDEASLRDYLISVQGTYAFELSKSIGLPVWAPPLGWGTNPHSGKRKYIATFPPASSEAKWWRVSDAFKKDEALRYYKDTLRVPVDVLGYVKTEPVWVTEKLKELNKKLNQP